MAVQRDPSVDEFLDQAAHLTAAEDYPGAESVLSEAIGRYPGNPVVMVARARLATRSEEWELAASRWRATLDRHGDTLGARAYTQAIRALRRNGEQAAAADVAATAVDRFRGNYRVLAEGAQVAMANESWSTALVLWVRWDRARRRKAQRDAEANEPVEPMALPLQSGIGDWNQSAWAQLVARLEEAAQMPLPPPPDFYLALLDVVRRAGLDGCEIDVLQHALGLYPESQNLVVALAMSRLRRGEQPELWPLDADAAVAFRRQFPPSPALEEGAIGPLRLITVRPGSAADLAVRDGHYYDRPRVAALIQELSARDRWPELDSDVDLLLAEARQLAWRFGSEASPALGLAPDVIADALTLTLYQELALFVPASRCAQEIAATVGEAPVIIECPGLEYLWLDGYAAGDFDVLYLYFALLRLGCNAFLRRADDTGNPDPAGFIFRPGWRSARSRLEVVPDRGRHARVLAPAGIRSVAQVAAQLPDCLVVATGSVIQEFAYSNNSAMSPIVAGAHLCDGEEDLPTFVFPVSRVAHVEGADLAPAYEDVLPSGATFEQSETIFGTWSDWLFRATGARLRRLKETAEALIEQRDIVEAHVADHMYTEPVVLADAVKRSGGRVVLWPHSTNPVHTALRRADSFDEVHAITRSGVRIWRDAFPGKPVHHTPTLMTRPDRKASPVEGGPLSIVVFGGRPVMGDMPVLDVAAHLALYRSFFAGISDLQRQFDIDLWFKPRGRTGEHEQWLERHVGPIAGWRPVFDHALELELPNPLFVSISSGSSALLEGLSRDIPGMIVRDFAIPDWMDYTTVDPRTFPILSLTAAVDQVRQAATVAGYRDLVERERVFYESEFGV